MSSARGGVSGKLAAFWEAARNPSFVSLAGGVIAVFALVARTWAAAWTTADLIACLVVAAVLIVAGTTAGLVEKNIDRRGREDAKDTARRAGSGTPSPGLKHALDRVADKLSATQYSSRFMIAPAPGGGEEVILLLPPDDFSRIRDEDLELFAQALERELKLKVSIIEIPEDWSRRTPPARFSPTDMPR
jgi:hypothetical protein